MKSENLITWLKIVAFVALVGCCTAKCTNADAATRYNPHTPAVVIHDHKRDPLPYIAAGFIAGVVVYHVTHRRCESGTLCIKF